MPERALEGVIKKGVIKITKEGLIILDVLKFMEYSVFENKYIPV